MLSRKSTSSFSASFVKNVFVCCWFSLLTTLCFPDIFEFCLNAELINVIGRSSVSCQGQFLNTNPPFTPQNCMALIKRQKVIKKQQQMVEREFFF